MLATCEMFSENACGQMCQLDIPVAERSGKLLAGRVLIVDDAPDFQRLLKYLLQRHGAKVEVVNDGWEAVEQILSAQAAGDPYDLVLMDYEMPGLDGCAAVMLLRSLSYELPIVGLSSHAECEVRRKFLMAGCDSFIPKPIHRDLFVVHLTRWLGAQRTFSPGLLQQTTLQEPSVSPK